MRLNAAASACCPRANDASRFRAPAIELDEQKGERTGTCRSSRWIAVRRLAAERRRRVRRRISGGDVHTAGNVAVRRPAQGRGGEADIGICFVTRAPAGTEIVASAAFPIGVVMATSHPLAGRAQIRYEDCAVSVPARAWTWPIYDKLAPAFADFWDSIEPRISSNAIRC